MVSVVQNKCDYARNAIRITDNRKKNVKKKKKKYQKRNKFVVCVKPISFPDASHHMVARLVEWIEQLLAYGATKIVIFYLKVSKEMKGVLDFYEDPKVGRVQAVPISLPGYYPNEAGYQKLLFKYRYIYHTCLEQVTYHTCLYDNMHDAQWVTPLDTDEIITPRKVSTWQALVRSVPKAHRYSNLKFGDVYYLDGNTEQDENSTGFHMMDHYMRSTDYDNRHSKVFYNTDRAVVMFNHFILSQTPGWWSYFVPNHVGQLSHYRDDCTYNIATSRCNKYHKSLTDDREVVWRHKDKVAMRSISVLETLNITDWSR